MAKVYGKGSMGMAVGVLLAVGALNWGLIGLLGINVVNMILGSWPTLERIVYILVGVAGVYKVYMLTMK